MFVASLVLGCGAPPPGDCARALTWADADGDGYGTTPGLTCPGEPGRARRLGDCDDRDPAVSPDAIEVCNGGVDDDCDPATDEEAQAAARPVYVDRDADGFGEERVGLGCPGPGESAVPGDCDDHDPEVHPGAAEVCNGGVDDDCAASTAEDEVAGRVSFSDRDGDGLGDPTTPFGPSCAIPVASVPTGTDCDDRDAAVGEPVEVYADADADGVGSGPSIGIGCGDVTSSTRSDDCDDLDPSVRGPRAWLPDLDGDGSGDDAAVPTLACEAPPDTVLRAGDCDDADPATHAGALELCDLADNDCDGAVDEGLVPPWSWPDADGDGRGDARVAPVQACVLPGRASRGGDCDEADPSVYAGAPERCDGVDDDCDGLVDEEVVDRGYLDQDGDGFGAGAPVVGCLAPGLVPRGGDCDAATSPGAVETCGGAVSDCDPRTDPCRTSCVWVVEGSTTTAYALDTAAPAVTLPCRVDAVRADGLVTRWDPDALTSAPALLVLDPASGTCDPASVYVEPVMPPPYEGEYDFCDCVSYDPDEYPGYGDGDGDGYYCDPCDYEIWASIGDPTFDARGHLWVPHVLDQEGGLFHYDALGQSALPSIPFPSSLAAYAVHAVGTERLWASDRGWLVGLDRSLARVAAAPGWAAEDALDDRMVVVDREELGDTRFADPLTGDTLGLFRPLDVRSIVAVGPGQFLVGMPDGSIVLTDGDGTSTPWLPSPGQRELLDLAPCP